MASVTTPADPKSPWLPPELWREILREVGAIFKEFEVHFASYWHHLRIRNAEYSSLWHVAIQNRYRVIRVSRLWHSLGVDFIPPPYSEGFSLPTQSRSKSDHCQTPQARHHGCI